MTLSRTVPVVVLLLLSSSSTASTPTPLGTFSIPAALFRSRGVPFNAADWLNTRFLDRDVICPDQDESTCVNAWDAQRKILHRAGFRPAVCRPGQGQETKRIGGGVQRRSPED